MIKKNALSPLWGSISFLIFRAFIVMASIVVVMRMSDRAPHLSSLIAVGFCVLSGMLLVYGQGVFPHLHDTFASARSGRHSVYLRSFLNNLIFILGFASGALTLSLGAYFIGDFGVQYLHSTFSLLAPVWGGLSILAYVHALARLGFLGVKYAAREHVEGGFDLLRFVRRSESAKAFFTGFEAIFAAGVGRPFMVLFFAWALLMHSVQASLVFTIAVTIGLGSELLVRSASARINRVRDALLPSIANIDGFRHLLMWIVVPAGAWSGVHGYVRGYIPSGVMHMYAIMLIAPLFLSLIEAYGRLGASDSPVATEALRLRALLAITLSLGVIFFVWM